MSDDWEELDTEKLLRKNRDQHEQTTSGGVGGYEVPLGGELLRPPTPPYEPVKKTKKQKRRK